MNILAAARTTLVQLSIWSAPRRVLTKPLRKGSLGVGGDQKGRQKDSQKSSQKGSQEATPEGTQKGRKEDRKAARKAARNALFVSQ